jgi:hypothetical protein
MVLIVRNSNIGPFAPPRKQSRRRRWGGQGPQRPITSCRRVGVTGPVPEIIKKFHALGGGGGGFVGADQQLTQLAVVAFLWTFSTDPSLVHRVDTKAIQLGKGTLV